MEDGGTLFTETQKKLFFKANNNDRRAVRRILDYGLFDQWLEWNVGLTVDLQALKFALHVAPGVGESAKRTVLADAFREAVEKKLPKMRSSLEAALMELVFAGKEAASQ